MLSHFMKLDLLSSIGNYRDAAACYERAIQLEPDDIGHHEVQLFQGYLILEQHNLWGKYRPIRSEIL